MQRAAEGREADAVKHSRQQELLQASKETLQKQLASTETEFRLALQVSSERLELGLVNADAFSGCS